MTQRILVLCGVLLLVGCAETRVVTINAKPADAMIKVDNAHHHGGARELPAGLCGSELDGQGPELHADA